MEAQHVGKALSYQIEKALNNKPIAHLKELKRLDRLLDGIRAYLYVIAAEPGTGETSFVLQIADALASMGIPVLFFTLEMLTWQLVVKSVSRLSKNSVPISSIVGNKMTLEQYSCFEKTLAIYQRDIWGNISFFEGQTDPFAIDSRTKLCEWESGKKPLIVVDYIQILGSSDELNATDERMAIKSSITGLRHIANKYEIPILAISSINRSSYNKTAISLEALGGSASIEYSSDVAAFLSVDGKAEKRIDNLSKPIRPLTLTLLKNRYGSTGKVSLNFDTLHAQFTESDDD